MAFSFRTRFIPIAGALLVAFTSIAQAAEHPNIVFIYVDDLGYGDMACTGASTVSTPNMDKLVHDGLMFTDGHCTASTCTPSRYSVLTGEYAFRNRLARVLPATAPSLIKPGTMTLASMLRSVGYATGCIGKWHVGLGNGSIDWNGEISPGPMELGFDESFIIPATPDRVPCVYIDGHRVWHLDRSDPLQVDYQKPIGELPTGKDHPELLRYGLTAGHAGTIIDRISRIGFMAGGKQAWWTDETMSTTLASRASLFIRHQIEKPFFLYFATNGIHVPRAPSQEFVHSSGSGLRGDTINELDFSIGRVLHTLEELNLFNNTLIILSSDNGPVLDDGYADGAVADGKAYRPAGPYRGGKYSIYEGGTRVPFVTYWQGHIKPGTSAALVSQVDLLASLADLTGATLNGEDAVDSVNVLRALLGQSPTGRDHMIEQSSPLLAMRQGQWKLIPPGKRPRLKVLEEGDTTEGPKLTEDGQLFDLSADPGEQHNVVSDHADIAKKLTDRLQAEQAANHTR